MKSKRLDILVLLGYCVPYPFLAMYGDVTSRTMLGYGVLLAAMGLLCWVTIKRKKLSVLVIGNVASFVSSCICIHLFQTERWGWYFKPLDALSLVIVISSIAFLIQLITWNNTVKTVKKKK